MSAITEREWLEGGSERDWLEGVNPFPPIDPWPEGYEIPDPGPCNMICLRAYEIGLAGSEIAYPHPDCPKHGDGLVYRN